MRVGLGGLKMLCREARAKDKRFEVTAEEAELEDVRRMVRDVGGLSIRWDEPDSTGRCRVTIGPEEI